MIRTFRELKKINNFLDRYYYLRLFGIVGNTTFGYNRYLNQLLYNSDRWKQTRNNVIIRDEGYDLGLDGYEISGRIIIHHMNPITIEDIENERDCVYDPEFLISTSLETHNAIHYGDENLLQQPLIVRRKNDTIPWL